MEYINRVELLGTVGRVSSTRIADKFCTRFSMVTNRCYKDKDGNAVIETTWHNVVAFSGENTRDAESLKKGDNVHVQGRICMQRYVSESGEPKTLTEIFAGEVKIVNGEVRIVND